MGDGMKVSIRITDGDQVLYEHERVYDDGGHMAELADALLKGEPIPERDVQRAGVEADDFAKLAVPAGYWWNMATRYWYPLSEAG